MDTSKRTTILFGNGLGMALDPNHFSLNAGMSNAWKEVPKISQSTFMSIINDNEKDMPESEDDLYNLQEVIFTIDTLSKYTNSKEWLTPEAKDHKSIYNRYIINVAMHYFLFHKSLPTNFIDPLCEFLRSNRCHIVTLNYDKLLYSALIDKKIIGKDIYNDCLCDGLWSSGFTPDNLIRKHNNKWGYYLHLHGSPLFYSDDNGIFKNSISELPSLVHSEKSRDHLVLTHYKHKPQVISKSRLLDTYWDYFNVALFESDRLIVFGYSGNDEHINLMINSWIQRCHTPPKIDIIEYKNDEGLSVRQKYWRSKLDSQNTIKDNITVFTLENILEFCDWDSS